MAEENDKLEKVLKQVGAIHAIVKGRIKNMKRKHEKGELNELELLESHETIERGLNYILKDFKK